MANRDAFLGSGKLELGILHRTMEVDRAQMDKEKRTVELSFSSELPVERYFGMEILDHSEKSIDMGRMKAGAPLLVEHDRGDQVGVIEKAWVAEKRGKALVRFGNSSRAQEIFQDVVDGIRRLVSVGYRVHKLVTESVENEVETLRAMRWEPHEISIVSVPADTSVGIGRSDSGDRQPVEVVPLEDRQEKTPPSKKKTNMSKEKNGDTKEQDPLDERLEKEQQVDVQIIREEAREIIRREHGEIMAIVGKMRLRYPEVQKLAEKAISGEMTLATFRKQAFDLTEGKPIDLERDQKIGIPEKDLAKWSWRRALLMAADPKMDGLEREMSVAAVDKYKFAQRGPNSIVVPYDVLAWSNSQQRDQLVATGSLGGNVVATNLLAGSFIDALRNRMLVARAGATMLPGLVGQVAIPRQSAAVATSWASSEAAAASEGSVTFDQVTLTPKQITARVDYSWLLLQQSTPAVDGLIRNDFQAQIARAIDLAALHGSGSSGQPTGVAATTGIGSVTGGSNGAAPTWANIVGLETEVAIDNADIGALAYISNAKVRGKLKTTLKGGTTATDGIYIWPEGPIADGFSMLNGYRIGTTNQVASNLTKGTSTTVASAIFFGNWSDLLIGMWSGLELLTNPYTQAATRIIESYAYQAVDVGVRHPESFAAMLDALTT